MVFIFIIEFIEKMDEGRWTREEGWWSMDERAGWIWNGECGI